MKLLKKTAMPSIFIALIVLSISFTTMVSISADTTNLSDEEIAGILFMREEEKLARDVYLTFADLYPSYRIFINIASSEQRHMDAIKKIINTYDLIGPVYDDTIGIFSNDTLQSLYINSVNRGSQSVIDALQVGSAIEEIDILDIKEYLEITDDWMINRIYNNLLDGSENHLRAFVNELSIGGIEYQPQYLDISTYKDILDADNDSGRNGLMGGRLIDWIRERFRLRYG